jgi:hypothetical protein
LYGMLNKLRTPPAGLPLSAFFGGLDRNESPAHPDIATP